MIGAFFNTCDVIYAQTEQATDKFQAANNALNQAFNAVLEAEKAGVNVTNLLSELNDAGKLLSIVQNSYRIGNLNEAIANVEKITPLAQRITAEAQSEKQGALVSAERAFWTNTALTVIAAIILVVVLMLLWRRVKRSYIQGLCQAKPEVVNSEA